MDPPQIPPPPNFIQKPKFDIFFEAFPKAKVFLTKHFQNKDSEFSIGSSGALRCSGSPFKSALVRPGKSVERFW